MSFVVARTRRGRPTLMHELVQGSATFTLCGLSVIEWSRAYFDNTIPQIQCIRCRRAGGH